MSGISIKIGLADEEARASLQQLLDRMDDTRGFYKGVGDRLIGFAGDNFERESDPDGTPWLSLRPEPRADPDQPLVQGGARHAALSPPIALRRARQT